MKHFLTVEIEAISYNHTAEQISGFRVNGPLQSGTRCLQDGAGNGALGQVQVISDGVDDDIRLWSQIQSVAITSSH